MGPNNIPKEIRKIWLEDALLARTITKKEFLDDLKELEKDPEVPI